MCLLWLPGCGLLKDRRTRGRNSNACWLTEEAKALSTNIPILLVKKQRLKRLMLSPRVPGLMSSRIRVSVQKPRSLYGSCSTGFPEPGWSRNLRGTWRASRPNGRCRSPGSLRGLLELAWTLWVAPPARVAAHSREPSATPPAR